MTDSNLTSNQDRPASDENAQTDDSTRPKQLGRSVDSAEPNNQSIHVMMVKLDIDEKPSLFVLLDRHGSVNRMGNGSVGNTDTDLFIGATCPDAFDSVCRLASPIIDNWLGFKWMGKNSSANGSMAPGLKVHPQR